jgi:hypothetical protein
VPSLGSSGSPTGVDGGDDAVRVFMSYRRTDDANFTGRFHDKLIGVFGDANVFRDIDSIPAGTRFEDVINARLADVDAVVALIGPTWAGRIDSPSDFVRMEIVHALASGTPVIPVLIEETPFPTADALPDDLKPMLDRQTVRVRRDPDFHRDAARVMDGVREAVNAGRERDAALRRVAEEQAQREREEEERRQAEISRRKELEAELARAEALAAEERRAAEALAAERSQRLADLARLEEEATQRRIADERAKVAAIVESQAARERDADAATARAAALRRALAGDEPIDEVEIEADAEVDMPGVASEATDAAALLEPQVNEPEAPVADVVVAETTDDDVVSAVPPEPATMTPVGEVPAGRRGFTSASRAEVIGGVLLLVATAFAVQALFDTTDGSNAFAEAWSTDVLALVLTAALLLPFLAFYYGINVHAICAGTAIGYLTFQGLADTQFFGAHDPYDPPFPTNMVFIAMLLAAAWFMFRRGSPLRPSRIDHPPSRYLQIAAAVGTLVTTLLALNQIADWKEDALIHVLFLAVAVGMVILSVRRSQEATILLATLAAETALACVTFAIADSDHRDRLQNIAIAAAVLTGAALWRTRRATPVEAG